MFCQTSNLMTCELIDTGDLNKHVLTRTGKKKHKCKVCDKMFCQTSNLMTCELIDTGEKMHKCEICAKALFGARTL